MDDHGRPLTATITVREDPAPKKRAADAPMFGPAIAVGVTCTFNTSPSVTVDTPTANGSFSQHMKIFFDRYTTSVGMWGYVSTQTNVWWSRLDANYDV